MTIEDRQQAVLTTVTEHYLTSRDFNGIPPGRVADSMGVSEDELRNIVRVLIEEELAAFNTIGNFHIKAFDDFSIEEQLKQLDKVDLPQGCLYPTKKHLQAVVDRTTYEGKPFTLRLALGEPQLQPLFFALDVLEAYRNDPRMRYWHNDIGGGISITDEACEAGHAEERDKVFLKTFGFAYNDAMDRAVAVYPCYLSMLTPEHQRMWEAKLLSDECSLHPDYYRTSICGEFPERWSLCDAFVREMRFINDMTRAMERPPLFRQTYESSTRPSEFGLMIRPTEKALHSFMHLLDKLISENINRNFFKGEIELEEEIERKDGRIEVRQKGTLRLLDEWLTENFEFEDEKPVKDMLECFKRIRKLRQDPAHSIREDKFDKQYFRDQRDLLHDAYRAIRRLRLILELDPMAAGVLIDKRLREGKVWPY